MGNAHTAGSSKKAVESNKDDVTNGAAITVLKDSIPTMTPPRAGLTSVADLTDLQKRLLQESWKRLEQDIAQVGIIVFINLFESHPDMQSAFLPFTGLVLDDLKKSKLLREHALRVMGAVQRAVFRLQEPEKLHTFLCELGRRHDKNGAKIEYIDYIGPQFLSAIRPSLGDDWTPELEQAWELLMFYMTSTMKQSILEARRNPAPASPKPPPSLPLVPSAPPSSSSASTTPAAADD